ncbi:hypothetical protein IF2G_01941 [Cordyceps javanica]|nr:hypothetical protein IF2G_01941 [Cordyceps javanica]
MSTRQNPGMTRHARGPRQPPGRVMKCQKREKRAAGKADLPLGCAWLLIWLAKGHQIMPSLVLLSSLKRREYCQRSRSMFHPPNTPSRTVVGLLTG